MLAALLTGCGGGSDDSAMPPSGDDGSGGSGSGLTLKVSVTGSGSVSDGGAIACGAACTANYAAGTSVSLTATPGTGYTFSGWGGDCAGTAAKATIVMNANASCTATFKAVSLSGPVQPVVHGKQLIDNRTGKVWTPHGANLPSLEYACVQQRPPPAWAANSLTTAASWGIDVIRLPLNENCWLGTNGAPNNGQKASDYQAQVLERVTAAHNAGMVVILDLHWSAPSGTVSAGKQPPQGQFPMADDQSAQFWSQVAAAYKDDPSVMFDLFNEPYSINSWACWRDGGCTASNAANGATPSAMVTVTGMAALVTAVRNAGATQPILLAGLNYANDLSGWLANKPNDPQSQLVASWHNYKGQGCDTNCWNSTIVSVAAQVPVVMTEFGYETSDTNYFASVMAWADSASVGIGYLPWAWWDQTKTTGTKDSRDPLGCDLSKPGCYTPYALYTGSNYGLTAEGAAYKSHLANLPH